jgi:NAD(P)-dependent dehydrogenase (short-subunit alcohol dehydrogenase family)
MSGAAMSASGTGDRSGNRAVPERLAGKRAIVTGAASGIGRASAIRFAAEGASVLIVDCEETGPQETLAAILDAGGRGAAQVADVGREDSVAFFVRRCIDELGGLEVMFANAGIAGAGLSLLEQTAEQWEEAKRVEYPHQPR